MSRTVSADFLRAMFSPETDEVTVALLTFTHPDIAEPFRFCNDIGTRLSDDGPVYGMTSRGDDFLFLPFSFTLPQDKGDVAPTVQLVLDSVNRDMVTILRSINTALAVKMEIVLASSPDIVERSENHMELSDITFPEGAISGTLTIDGLIAEPYPAGQFTPNAFRGLF